MNEFFEVLCNLYEASPVFTIAMISWWILNIVAFVWFIVVAVKGTFTLIEMGITKLWDKIRGIKSEK